MKSVAKDNICTDGFDITWQHTFDGTISANWHKSWRLYIAMIEMNGAATRTRVAAGRFM